MWGGVAWLVKHIIDNMDSLQARLKADSNMKIWQEHLNRLITEGRIKQGRYRQFQYHLKNTARRKLWYRSFTPFRTKRIRPHTAPATINGASFSQLSKMEELATKSLDKGEESDVPI
ncbi:PREDICTED: uncharacterized protein LOC108978821 [Bactrocera latifrons]|nr:PREDICTED: uncharacterized protein LOC108978821 [Bactrocera latifrons]